MKDISVMSLCDGISCGAVALENLGISTRSYYDAEIKKYALKFSERRWPAHIRMGDVTKIFVERNGDAVRIESQNGTWTEEKGIDLFLCGSPCQSFSCAMRSDMRTGLSDQKRSGLFLKCYDIFKAVKPKFFLWENVASMKESDRDTLSEMIGVEPVYIDSADFSAQTRKRLYWTNIPLGPRPGKCGKVLKDILESGTPVKVKLKDGVVLEKGGTGGRNDGEKGIDYSSYRMVPYEGKAKCLLAAASHCLSGKPPHYAINSMFRRQVTFGGSGNLVLEGNDLADVGRWRALSTVELERLQTLPEGYTAGMSRRNAADCIGDGWTVKVIEYILSALKGDAEPEGASYNPKGQLGFGW